MLQMEVNFGFAFHPKFSYYVFINKANLNGITCVPIIIPRIGL